MLKYPNQLFSILKVMADQERSGYEFICPTYLAYIPEDFNTWLSTYLALSTRNTLVKLDLITPTLTDKSEFLTTEISSIAQVLPPDHHTVKAVAAGNALVIENLFDNIQFSTIYSVIKDSYYGGERITEKNMFTVSSDDISFTPMGLNYEHDSMTFNLFSGTVIPTMGGGFIGDFSLIMRRRLNNPSSSVPFYFIPSLWIDTLGIEKVDVSYAKQKAFAPEVLKPGYWYSLPAGKTALFCGWTTTGMVFCELKGSLSKTTDSKAMYRQAQYGGKDLNFKLLTRNGYCFEHEAFSEPMTTILKEAAAKLQTTIYTDRNLIPKDIP